MKFSLVRCFSFLAIIAALRFLAPAPAQAAESAAEKAMRTRVIESCGLNCGNLTLVSGRETIFKLSFAAIGGANGISLGDPTIVATTLIKIGAEPGKEAAEKYELAVKALKEGKSSLTLRTLGGETAAHFDLTVVK